MCVLPCPFVHISLRSEIQLFEVSNDNILITDTQNQDTNSRARRDLSKISLTNKYYPTGSNPQICNAVR